MNTLCSLFRASLLLTVLLAVLSSSVRAQFGRDTIIYKCDHSQTIDLGQTFKGRGTIDDTLFIHTDKSEYRIGDTAYVFWNGDTTNITLTQTTNTSRLTGFPPHFIVSDSIFIFTIHFAPKISAKGQSQVDLQISKYSNGSCSDTFSIIGTAIDTTAKNDSIPLVAPNPRTVAFIAKQDTSLFYVRLYNNLSADLKIKSMRLYNGFAFRIDSGISYPVILPSHSVFNVPLLYTPKASGQTNDYLIVSMPDEGPLLDVVPIQGFFDPPPKSVQIAVTRAEHFAVYPNPSHGDIIVHADALSRSRIEIMDMLGRTLEEKAFDGDWQWNRDASLPSGAYFLIVTGTTESGQKIREVQTVVLE